MGSVVDEEAPKVEGALAARDAKHAAHHLASIVAVEPMLPAVGGWIERLAGIGGDPLDAVPITEGMFYGAIVLRAMLLDRAGRSSEAVELLLCAWGAVPTAPLLPLFVEWCGTDEKLARLDIGAIVRGAIHCLGHRATAAGILPTMLRLHERGVANEHLGLVLGKCARLTGQPKKALELAEAAYARAPSAANAIAIGAAAREVGDARRAIEGYRLAHQRAPDDIAVLLDIGDLHIKCAELDAAERVYDDVLRREPHHPWAEPSRAYVRVRAHDDADARRALESMARSVPPNARARHLFDLVEPWSLELHPPGASIVQVARDVAARGLTPQGTVTISSMEPPSAILAARRMLGTALPVGFAEIPSPDPRLPREGVAFRLWTYRGADGALGIEARPTSDPPNRSVVDRVAGLASSSFSLEGWTATAAQIAHELGREALPSLLGVMVHLPDAPERAPHDEWIFRIQVAAALVLAKIDEGWSGSLRARALLAILDNPLDWTTIAALVACAQIGVTEPKHAQAILSDVFVPRLQKSNSPIEYACVMRPAVFCVLRLPLPDDDTRRALERVRFGLAD